MAGPGICNVDLEFQQEIPQKIPSNVERKRKKSNYSEKPPSGEAISGNAVNVESDVKSENPSLESVSVTVSRPRAVIDRPYIHRM